MSVFIKILAEKGYHSYAEVLINPAYITSASENSDRRVRITMADGQFFDTCHTMTKFKEILNGGGGADG